ncbi:MAG: right-handed parallel beta-helix repeat-containing protein [Prevotella sp.]|nr:right-handed parallel beta-helix repeat-containing protein [Prevotella sp.]
MMKRLAYILLALALTTGLSAQTAREEIRANKYLSGSNYLDYDNYPATQPLTPAPKGYVPFYMSHYGRHGSRWLISTDSYTSVTRPLQLARKAGKLTAKGEEVLRLVEQFVSLPVADYPALDGQYAGAQLRLGDLSTVGERQHHGIGRRMAQHFPEIFKQKDVMIDARSTVVNRCILSMMAECEELAAANPTARIHNDVSEALQYYLNAPRSPFIRSKGRQGRELRRTLSKHITPDRLMGELFSDANWVKDNIQPLPLMYNLFEVVTNMQSHDTDIDLFSLYTDDEIYEQWRMRNIGWYVDYGPAPQTDGVMPFTQRNLLRNIIETADTIRHIQATLRFGHEVCVMPLACLLELDSCGAQVNDLDQLDNVWRNYKIFPMACNIQLIFYAPKKSLTSHLSPLTSNDDVLVKALLNEREVSLPIPTTQYPYYKWSDLRRYYLDKLDRFDAAEAAWNAANPQPPSDYARYYERLPISIKPVQDIQIPANRVNLRDFGAVGDGTTLNTEAFQRAIAKLTSMGGGRLTVPQGMWLTGPIRLESNIELHLERNAIIYMSPDKTLYLDAKNPQGRVKPCISAAHCKNIAITGDGIIDGNGADWYYVKRDKLSDYEWKMRLERGGKVEQTGKPNADKRFDKGAMWFPWQMKSGYPDIAETAMKQERMRNDLVRLEDCENVLLKDVTFQNSPRFHVHPYYCRNMIVDGIKIRCPWNAQNGDGIDITDCHEVLLVRSTIDVGDDGMCFKSDPPKPGLISGNEDIVVEDNLVRHAHGGFVMGSNTSSGMRRIVVRNNTFCETDTGLRFKSGVGRGGKTEDIFISDILMTDIAHEAIIFQCDYADKAPGETTDLYLQKDYMKQFTAEQLQWTPDFQDMHISRITCRGTQTAIKAAGLPGADCVHDITVSDSRFIYNKVGNAIDTQTARITLDDVEFIENKKQ